MDTYVLINNNTLIYSPTLSTSFTYGTTKKISVNRREDKELCQLSYDINFINVNVNIENDIFPTIIYIDPYSTHALIKLMILYDFINFEIYDQVPMDRELEDYVLQFGNRVKFYHTTEYDPAFFQDKYGELKNKYLISTMTDVSIRNKVYEPEEKIRNENHIKKEEIVAVDTKKNIEVAIAINATKSILKFRPFHVHTTLPGKVIGFPFFNGTIILPIFSGLKSSDCRMIVSDYNEIITWDSEKFTYIINNWNRKTRESLALNPFNGKKEPLPNQMGNNFEISVLFMILKDYFLCIGHLDPTAKDVYNLYSKFIIDDEDENDFRCGR